jgi:hypothetical protein
MIKRRQAAGRQLGMSMLVGFVFMFVCSGATADLVVIPDKPDPTRAELLKAAGIAADDSKALLERLQALLEQNPMQADVWLPFLREGEYAGLIAELQTLGLGEWPKQGQARWREKLPKLEEELAARRLHSAPRQIDAILRQLETVGRLDQIDPLMSPAKYNARTSWGKWKFYATVQGILARHKTDEIIAAKLEPIHELAPLLRDLDPDKAGKLAIDMLDRLNKLRKTMGDPVEWRTIETRLWLAWSASYADPERAFGVFREQLSCPDPAWRLFGGMGISRISDSAPTFSLTAPPEQVAEARRKWLESLSVRPADPWRPLDPLSMPVIKEYRNYRRDLWWLDKTGQIIRQEQDVWPSLQMVLSDGSFYSRYRATGLALTSAAGEVFVRFPDVDYRGVLANHGGLWALIDNTTTAAEYAPTGDLLWACPTSRSNASARLVAGAGPGHVLLVRYGRVELLNRRGDVLKTVQGNLDDPRYACMVGPEKLLIACTKELVVHDLAKGEQERIGGFTSLFEIRCGLNAPWVLFDGGETSVILYDPTNKARTSISLHAKDKERSESRWGKPMR